MGVCPAGALGITRVRTLGHRIPDPKLIFGESR
jgi:hypothetical protein